MARGVSLWLEQEMAGSSVDDAVWQIGVAAVPRHASNTAAAFIECHGSVAVHGRFSDDNLDLDVAVFPFGTVKSTFAENGAPQLVRRRAWAILQLRRETARRDFGRARKKGRLRPRRQYDTSTITINAK